MPKATPPRTTAIPANRQPPTVSPVSRLEKTKAQQGTRAHSL